MWPTWPEQPCPPAPRHIPHRETVIPTIAASAFKHGISEEDIMHAYRNPIWGYLQGDRVLLVGGDWSGNLLEIGIEEDAGHDVIIHAMPARGKFLP